MTCWHAMTEKLPNPGSDEAIEQGCKCPVMDNHNGEGIGYTDGSGTRLYYINEHCPVHVQQDFEFLT